MIPFDLEDLDDPDFLTPGMIKKWIDKQTQVSNQFWMHWKDEYLTSLREFHWSSGHNGHSQVIKRGDVVIVHDEKARLHWKLAIAEDLIKGRDDYVRAANIRMCNLRTSCPILSFGSLKLWQLRTSDFWY